MAREQAFGFTRPDCADIARAAGSRFLPALGMGLAISAVASLGWDIVWEFGLAVTKLDVAGVCFEAMA
jgi:hypothetical protein